MAFGSILTVYRADDVTLNQVNAILGTIPFKRLENVFFIKFSTTTSMIAIDEKLFESGINYTMYYAEDATGDVLKANGVSDDDFNNIKNLLQL